MLKCARTRATVQHEGAWHHRLYRSPEHWNSQRRRADLEDVKNYFRLFGRHYDKAIVADMQAEPLRHLFLPASYCSLYPRQSPTPHLVLSLSSLRPSTFAHFNERTNLTSSIQCDLSHFKKSIPSCLTKGNLPSIL